MANIPGLTDEQYEMAMSQFGGDTDTQQDMNPVLLLVIAAIALFVLTD